MLSAALDVQPVFRPRIDRYLQLPSYLLFRSVATREKTRCTTPVPIISASVLICQDVLTEKANEIQSAFRMMSVLNIPTDAYAHFYSLSTVYCSPGDYSQHRMSVRMETAAGAYAASAPDHEFRYGYKQDRNGYGGYLLTTKFDIELAKLPSLGWFLIHTHVDGVLVASAPLMLRR